MFCFHKYGIVSGRYQTCEKCGKTRVVECPHKWGKPVRFTATQHGRSVGETWVFTCEECGEVMQKWVGIPF